MSLAQPFYQDRAIFQLEFDTIIRRQWLLADHESRIPAQGDYFLVKVAQDTIIVVRARNNRINAFYNVCRHRGTTLCEKTAGRLKQFVCPYHAWSYDLDGHLRQARDMPASFNKGEYGLVPCRLEVVEGLIFLCLDEDAPADFNRSHGAFLPYLKLHGTAGARIAHHEQWTVQANWKLLYENFGECYHCAGVHPEFLKLYRTETLAAFGAGPASAGVNAELAGRFSAWAEKAEELGHHTASVECNGDGNYFSYAARAPFDFDALTLSADGKPLAPLMGEFRQYDGAMSVIALNPVSCILGYNDYSILLRFIPRSVDSTDVLVTWLVDKNARAGIDYDRDRLTEIGLAVMRADTKLTDLQQQGIATSGYRPGVYSRQEQLVDSFIRWYLKQLQAIVFSKRFP